MLVKPKPNRVSWSLAVLVKTTVTWVLPLNCGADEFEPPPEPQPVLKRTATSNATESGATENNAMENDATETAGSLVEDEEAKRMKPSGWHFEGRAYIMVPLLRGPDLLRNISR
jgi:hypothetical protein